MGYGNYILVNGEPVLTEDLQVWSLWFDHARKEGKTLLGREILGDVKVTTVFLGIDHSLGTEGPPLVFGTLISGGPHDEEWNYSTLDEALEGHARAIAFVKGEEYGPREWSPRKGKCFCHGQVHPGERGTGSGAGRP